MHINVSISEHGCEGNRLKFTRDRLSVSSTAGTTGGAFSKAKCKESRGNVCSLLSLCIAAVILDNPTIKWKPHFVVKEPSLL